MKNALIIAASLLLGFSVLAYVVSGLRLSVNSSGETFGVHSQTVKQAACTDLTTNSRIPGSLYNGDGSRRIITSVNYYLDDTSGSLGGVSYPLEFGVSTSTSATATSTYYAFFPVTTITTSTAPQFSSTSTFTVVLNRVWNTGEYLNLGVGDAASTTGKFCVEYYK